MTDTARNRIEDLAAFAAANGWTYQAAAEPPALSGDMWEYATAGNVQDRIAGADWEVGRIVGGARKAESVRQSGIVTIRTSVSINVPVKSINLGYLAIRLPRQLPHFVLDARSNNGILSSLQHQPRRNQRLSLEGDFDTHFHLFAPKGYERDALYVFTPDLMALLIDETGDLDVEVRDDMLIVYRPGGFDLHDPAVWERFARIRATVGAKAWTQTDGYSDDRAVPGLSASVGPEGRRLKRSLPRWAWIAIGIAGAAVLVTAGVLFAVFGAVPSA
ncbi:hypothetical protein QE430_002681 [Microbacterium testaceum]|uniref:hypothetical protein n=1 Tax=Microbacterium testaceum TaxID=2033 RepID=UPI00277FACD0|nr:hypothetical protein [Microbacterium testaceum]MDQ1174374.1 hypothetical protein [Microbacterium testaceum]